MDHFFSDFLLLPLRGPRPHGSQLHGGDMPCWDAGKGTLDHCSGSKTCPLTRGRAKLVVPVRRGSPPKLVPIAAERESISASCGVTPAMEIAVEEAYMRKNRWRLAFSRRLWAAAAGFIPSLTERGLKLGIVAEPHIEYPEATQIGRSTIAAPSRSFG